MSINTICSAHRSLTLPIVQNNRAGRDWRLLQFAGWLCLLASFFICRAPAQVVVPGLRIGPQLSTFGTFSVAKPNDNYFTDLAVYGFTVGGYLQSHRVIGLELRGSINRWGGGQHEESGLAGFRGAMHFGRFSPYASVLGGAANAWSRTNLGRTRPISEEVGPEWSIVAGLDVHLQHHLFLRMGEYSYSQIYIKERGLTPMQVSAGFVYRVR